MTLRVTATLAVVSCDLCERQFRVGRGEDGEPDPVPEHECVGLVMEEAEEMLREEPCAG